MTLDTKQKRGSVVGMTQPHRQWLAEPDATLAATDRLSLMKLGSAEDPSPPPTFVVAWARNANTIVGTP